MLAEFFDKLAGVVKQANSTQFLSPPEAPGRLWMRNGEEVTEVELAPPLRKPALVGYDDLVAFLANEDLAPKPEVYLSAVGVTAYLDGDARREFVTVRLCETKRFGECVALQTAKSMQPRDVVKMLRFQFHATNVEHVIQKISRLDFQRTSSGKTSVDHGRETLGRTVEAMVQQADEVPKDFEVVVPVWSNPGFSTISVPITIGVHLDLDAQVVQLVTLPDEIERARNVALNTVAKQLRESLAERDVPVFLGTA